MSVDPLLLIPADCLDKGLLCPVKSIISLMRTRNDFLKVIVVRSCVYISIRIIFATRSRTCNFIIIGSASFEIAA
uniref:Uncharacterized protein n=1 Tax=Heterorhabditis bacteriophora TaxID=37862 RepID=A0A1I7XEE5_HETBA